MSKLFARLPLFRAENLHQYTAVFWKRHTIQNWNNYSEPIAKTCYPCRWCWPMFAYLNPLDLKKYFINYADDFTLLCPQKSTITVEEEIADVMNWAVENKMTVNLINTVEIVFFTDQISVKTCYRFKCSTLAVLLLQRIYKCIWETTCDLWLFLFMILWFCMYYVYRLHMCNCHM